MGIAVFIIFALIIMPFFYGNTEDESSGISHYKSSILPVAGLICAPVVLISGYNIVSDRLVSEYDSKASRNLETGILVGAEQRDIGPPDSPGAVLLVHGFLGAGNNFNNLPERLAESGWRVRVMRLPGHGTTPHDLEKESPESMIQAVEKEIEYLRQSHETVVMVGHSMGGTIGALIAAEDKVDRLVLCAPYFSVTREWYYILKPETWTHISYPFVRWVYKSDAFIKVNNTEIRNNIVSYRWVPLHGVKILTELGKRAISPDVPNRITCPVLLLHALGDEAASPEASEAIYNAIKSSDKHAVWLQKSNHHIFWDYEHIAVIDEIVRFIGLPENSGNSQ